VKPVLIAGYGVLLVLAASAGDVPEGLRHLAPTSPMNTSTEAPGSTSAPEDSRGGAASPSPSGTSVADAPIGGPALKLRLRFNQAVMGPRDAAGSSQQPVPLSETGPGGSGIGPAPASSSANAPQWSGNQLPVNYGASTSGLSRPVRSPPPHEVVDDRGSNTSHVEPEDLDQEGEWTMSAVVEARVQLASALDDLDAAHGSLDSVRLQLTELNTDMEVSLREAGQRRLRVQELDQQIARKVQDFTDAREQLVTLLAERDEAQSQREAVRADVYRLREELADSAADLRHLEEERNDLRTWQLPPLTGYLFFFFKKAENKLNC
jgi:hypothetical protein